MHRLTPGPIAVFLPQSLELAFKPDDVASLPPLRNPEVLVGAADLTDLSYLHEPAVLHNLHARFVERNMIYTYCGIVLVAINPYADVPLYSTEMIHAYSGRAMGELDPHIFAVAEDAFSCLARENKNQSIIVSGESGAGKTVSAKFAMRYFATVGGAQAETQIERKVLASNPVMESIGNAKTTRNDNSSRFGKYIEILFDQHNQIIGAEMRTYLLEKSRVVYQAETELNYHIFYQLCAAANEPELEALELTEADEFIFANQGGVGPPDGVDYFADFGKTKQALSLLGVSDQMQLELFSVLAAILHMGNMEVRQRSRRREDADIPETDTHLPVAARLLGVDEKQLAKWITNRKIQTGREVFIKAQTVDQAQGARDALAKHIYAHIFDWVVARINEVSHQTRQRRCIGVLDIYGFETFKVNSFEQFCINWANEKLQQQFNLHVFKLEQDEYVREAITWSFIDFYDNQPCIDLLEDKFGVLSLLDEETKLPKGSDQNWALKMYDRLTEREHFRKPRMGNETFLVKHYADLVEYTCNGFTEKNKDTIFEEHLIMLRESKLEMVQELFAEGKGRKVDIKKMTVGSQFKLSLDSLMETLNATDPHYIRCIKPNDAKQAFAFDTPRVVQQLRACGVLETIRISAAGYPSRWSYPDFCSRYALLQSGPPVSTEPREQCKSILEPLIEDTDKYQFGKTKLFFRAGQVAYLEKLRSEKMRRAMILIQSTIRGFLQRRRYQRVRTAAVALQAFGRGLLARAVALRLRQTAAAITLQRHLRGWSARQTYAKTRRAIITLQCFARGLASRRMLNERRRDVSAIRIQSCFRMWLCRKDFLRQRRAAVTLQCGWRSRTARREFSRLRTEARSVAGIKAKNTGLEKKIIELQQTMDRRIKEVTDEQVRGLDRGQLSQLGDVIAKLRAQLETAEAQASEGNKTSQADMQRLQQQNADLESALADARDALDRSNNDTLQNTSNLEAQIQTLTQELEASAGNVAAQATELDELRREAAGLRAELQEERAAHQHKIKVSAFNVQKKVKVQISWHAKFTFCATLQTCMELEERLAQSEEQLKAAEDQLLSTARVQHAGSDLALAGSDDDAKPGDQGEYIEVAPDASEATGEAATEAELRAQVAQLQAALEANTGSAKPSTGDSAETEQLRTAHAELLQKTESLEKQLVDWQAQVAAAQAQVDQLKRENKELLVSAVPSSSAALTEENSAQAADKGENMLDLAKAKTKLQESNHQLQEELDAARRQLQDMQDEAASLKQSLEDIHAEKQAILDHKNKLEQALSKKLSSSTSGPAVDGNLLQEEVRVLIDENLAMREQVETLEARLRAVESGAPGTTRPTNASSTVSSGPAHGGGGAQAAAGSADGVKTPPPAPTHLGMLKFQEKDIQRIVSALVLRMRPETAKAAPQAHLPAHLLFMCVLFADYQVNAPMLQGLLTKTMRGLKQVVTQNSTDLQMLSFWLANGYRLLTNMKQFSGDPQFQTRDDPSSMSLKNFDLMEYRRVLSDLLVQIYHTVLKHAELKLQPLTVPGMLEFDSLPGAGGAVASKRSGPAVTIGDIFAQLTAVYDALTAQKVEPRLVQSVFRQLYYGMNATMVNTLLLRKDLARLTKGMQVRYNITKIEEWAREHRMESICSVLAESVQLTQLLQCKKTAPEDAQTIFETCTDLNPLQIQKILQMYSPEEFEERVPASLLRAVSDRQLQGQGDGKLLLDTKHIYPVTFPFSPCAPRFPMLELPAEYGLDFLEKI
ncbi:uncharacterized protein MONBRDRAFT_17957 [Monosiga brevicollis MX1]|uniref:Myosin motor domain-containing protein n=1 Tax=Monosiga brevicollis TaxID=81824 RepID=A9UTC5_MONBE|nr:uncharacterized protein MONBRDRAFT_17957 [Monosiga brevicollis MX1]EDQ91224.1 predicted protein [Monosiga brevicollis MX1]|eukprot:XP_001743646.1 hypothetical protein [Monosiga brevicollis MX1]